MIPRYRAWIKTENCFADYIESIRFYINEIDLCWGGICESDCFNFEDSGRAKIVFKEGMFKLLDVRTGEEVWDNLFDCIENCNVYLQGNIYENPEFLEDKE